MWYPVYSSYVPFWQLGFTSHMITTPCKDRKDLRILCPSLAGRATQLSKLKGIQDQASKSSLTVQWSSASWKAVYTDDVNTHKALVLTTHALISWLHLKRNADKAGQPQGRCNNSLKNLSQEHSPYLCSYCVCICPSLMSSAINEQVH